jgi:thioredoxin reductase (NADPH)
MSSVQRANPREPTSGEPPIPYHYDVIVIGGGPAGASAAIYLARAELSTLVLDRGLTVGALGITGKISNYPGVKGPVTGAELLSIMREQARDFGAEFVTDKVVGLELASSPKIVFTNGAVYHARALILATGSMGRIATVPGEERLLGKGVSYCATCDGAFFKGQSVAVAGNHDEALDEALLLSRFASTVHLLVPTSTFKASPEIVSAIESCSNMEISFGTRILAIEGENSLSGVRLVDRSGIERALAVSGVFVYLQGNRPITDYLADQVDRTTAGCLRVDAEMQTSVAGVFAVGDLLCTHVKQAVIAAADGVVAAISVEKHLSGRKKTKADWG